MKNSKLIYFTIFIILISAGVFFTAYSLSPFNKQKLSENNLSNDVIIYREMVASQNCKALEDEAFQESCNIEIVLNKALTEDNETICNQMPRETQIIPCMNKIYLKRALENPKADYCEYIELEISREECNDAVKIILENKSL